MLTKKNQVLQSFPNGIEKLEIGSGNNPESGYVHLDILPNLPDLDILSDVRKTPIPDNFVRKEVRAVHIMEHFCHPEYSSKSMQKRYGTTVEVVKEVYRILKPGGTFFIVTPDFEKICTSSSLKRVSNYWLQRWAVGGHENEYDVHHWLWTYQDAKRWFKEARFKDCRNCNPTPEILGKPLLNWKAEDVQGNMDWHKIEWYHWLFIRGKK
ncbi:MAG: hypothetical protein HZA34_01275 [Candidatus Pacebacteria bacterium]|nr:hypothetical protein [Candidatus Paceibacterota bacterium]